ncbi:hypothetical protein DXG03_000950 [Asterophora parasitica]|uniref:Uncharacterized protein n=1 Tax=Asterophora parasitica TaxID=117018 RepID=A0A9P7K7M0_9AGAR|nr:hypothetical protein DXG03_000950 [Asterophora parasitica]
MIEESDSALPEFEIPPARALRKGRNPGLHIFGWAFRPRDLVRSANENNVGVGEDDHVKHQLVEQEIAERLGPLKLGCAYAPSPDVPHGRKLCFILTDNRTPESLEKAKDMKRINQFRTVLGPDAELKWHCDGFVTVSIASRAGSLDPPESTHIPITNPSAPTLTHRLKILFYLFYSVATSG